MTILEITAHDATVRMHDTGGKVSRCMQQGVPYERPLLEHIHTRNYTGTAVDAGANIGNHTLWMSQMCGLYVVAFEPLQHELLRQHVDLNDAGDRVRIETAALGEDEGTATHVGKGRLDPTDRIPLVPTDDPDVAAGRWTGSGSKLDVRTLDSYHLTGVSVIKVDIEGMEPAMLRGAAKTLADNRPDLYVEEWTVSEHQAIAAVLEPWDYQMVRCFNSKESATPVGWWRPREAM